jgi:predicted transcriptional regulator
MEKTTIYLPDNLRIALKDMARRSGRPQAELIREALAAFVARQERPRPKSFGIASSGKVQATEVEAWLDEHWTHD